MRVVVEFSKEKAGLVEARVWHPDQELERLPNGRLRLHFTVSNLTPIVSWVLEWGPHARALAPTDLVDAVVEELRRAQAQY